MANAKNVRRGERVANHALNQHARSGEHRPHQQCNPHAGQAIVVNGEIVFAALQQAIPHLRRAEIDRAQTQIS